MSAVDRISLPLELPPAALWQAAAAAVARWVAAHGLAMQDVVVLLPYAQLLPEARRAFAALGGWQPRLHTTHTLAASLAPPSAPGAGPSGQRSSDELAAAALLRRQPWGQAWRDADEPAFMQAAAAMLDCAWQLGQGAQARGPQQRAAYWAQARSELGGVAGPGAVERQLARVAAEWAALNTQQPLDALFTHRPAAWVCLQAGGEDTLVASLFAQAAAPAPGVPGVPCLVLDTDAPAQDPFAATLALPAPRVLVCDNLEGEAQAAAAQVIAALNAGAQRLALVTQDRLLARRIRSLLERQGLALDDETGWKLATTRAAAALMLWLRAAATSAPADAWLDWLKAGACPVHHAQSLDALEALWRRGAQLGARTATPGTAAALWRWAEQALAGLAQPGQRPLASWLQALAGALAGAGQLAPLQADSAGLQCLHALKLIDHAGGDPSFAALAQATLLDLAGFTRWLDATLEATLFLPPPQPAARVLLTPPARALLREFDAVIVPGADAKHLGPADITPGLLGDASAARLGLPHRRARVLQQQQALVQLLRCGQLTFLRRRHGAQEALAPSPWLLWMALLRAQGKAEPWREETWQAPLRSVEPQPSARPAPAAAQALPASLSASAIEALRECPYRFFATRVLGLGEIEELEGDADKRAYGTWLHAVLNHFHTRRQPGADDPAALLEAAQAVSHDLGLDATTWLPFQASFEALLAPYVQWLHQRDAQGWQFRAGEVALETLPEAWGGVRLRGVIDRIDDKPQAPALRQLIDYKTGALSGLRKRVAQPLEDTQLAVYAALVRANLPAAGALRATYLALDDPAAPAPAEHGDVATTAQVLVQEIGHELERLRQGAGLPALGEGQVCETCAARGLCRRDHWAAS